MNDSEMAPFLGVLGRMGAVFNKRDQDLQTLAPSYFRALQRFPYADVVRAAEHLITVEQHFPRPSRWIAAIGETHHGEPLPALTGREAGEHLDAQRKFWEDLPCGCDECLEAGVADRPIRFVPVEPLERVMLGNQATVRGRWIHAWELAAWYTARANCYEVMQRVRLGHPVRAFVREIFPEAVA